MALGKEKGWEDHKLLLHCHIYIQHVLVLFFPYSTCLCYTYTTAPSLRDVDYRLPSGVVHLLSSPWDLLVVSVFPCYPKEMRCDWSHLFISIGFSHVEYLHSFGIQLGNRNPFSTFLFLWVESTQFSSIKYFSYFVWTLGNIMMMLCIIL